MKGLYRGYSAALLRNVPSNVISFSTFVSHRSACDTLYVFFFVSLEHHLLWRQGNGLTKNTGYQVACGRLSPAVLIDCGHPLSRDVDECRSSRWNRWVTKIVVTSLNSASVRRGSRRHSNRVSIILSCHFYAREYFERLQSWQPGLSVSSWEMFHESHLQGSRWFSRVMA